MKIYRIDKVFIVMRNTFHHDGTFVSSWWKLSLIVMKLQQLLYKTNCRIPLYINAVSQETFRDSLCGWYSSDYQNQEEHEEFSDIIMLRMRSIIKTVKDELENICQIEYTRYCSVENFATNLLVRLIVYNLLPKSHLEHRYHW